VLGDVGTNDLKRTQPVEFQPLKMSCRDLRVIPILRSRRAAEDGVAVWKAVEAVNDVLVRQRVSCQLWLARCRNELEASSLCIGILLMLERQIEEELFVAVRVSAKPLAMAVSAMASALASLANALGVPPLRSVSP
jgi:hypothetical protein